MRSAPLDCVILVVVMGLVSACSATASAPVKSSPPSEPEGAEIAQPEQPTTAGPTDVPIGEISLDPEQTIRIKGMISAVLGMRMVPPKVIFKLTDNTGTVTAIIMEQTTLSEGARMELVGVYKQIPSPMYAGPGEAPLEDVFVVERYLDLQ